MLKIKQRGNFNNMDRFLKKMSNRNYLAILKKYGQEGVDALALATPEDTGNTAESWGYEIVKYSGSYVLRWYNTNIVDGVKIAVILQYGHGTRNGGYVQGVDYINPTLKPIFDKIANEAWREVTRA